MKMEWAIINPKSYCCNTPEPVNEDERALLQVGDDSPGRDEPIQTDPTDSIEEKTLRVRQQRAEQVARCRKRTRERDALNTSKKLALTNPERLILSVDTYMRDVVQEPIDGTPAQEQPITLFPVYSGDVHTLSLALQPTIDNGVSQVAYDDKLHAVIQCIQSEPRCHQPVARSIFKQQLGQRSTTTSLFRKVIIGMCDDIKSPYIMCQRPKHKSTPPSKSDTPASPLVASQENSAV
jgi:hypothetical protein